MEKHYTILCVDDEESILNSLKRTLRMKEYTVLTALSGDEGLKILDDNPVDMVISDQRMPKMSGFEFLREVKQKHPACTRIMLSGYSDFESLIKTINEGEIIHYISKPWDNEELKAIIKRTLEKNQMVHHVGTLLENVRRMVNLAEGLQIDTKQEENNLILRISSKDKIVDEKSVYNLIKFLFETLGIEGKETMNVLNNAVSKRNGVIIFNIDLGKGVNLKIEVPSQDQ
ncbi:MAG: response regulator [Candidatus Omnitrophota bacterium]